MAQRVTLRKRQSYNTVSNRRRVIKTPGGKLVYHHLKKPASSPKCGDCGIGLPGVSSNAPAVFCFANLVTRSQPCAPVNMPPSPNAKKLFAGHTVVQGVEIV